MTELGRPWRERLILHFDRHVLLPEAKSRQFSPGPLRLEAVVCPRFQTLGWREEWQSASILSMLIDRHFCLVPATCCKSHTHTPAARRHYRCCLAFSL